MLQLTPKTFDPHTIITGHVAYRYNGCPCTLFDSIRSEFIDCVLTTEHPTSSYGQPVLVANDADETPLGAGDLDTIHVLTATPHSPEEAAIAIAAYYDSGYRLTIDPKS